MSIVDEVLRGTVDLYVHCMPDLLQRRGGDLDLAGTLREAGFAAAVHRHHFASTVERSAVTSEVTGFALLGAVLLNDSLGGVNPWAVEVALRHGARWIGMPTLSAAFFRSTLTSMPAEVRDTLALGPGVLRLTDDDSVLLDAAREVLRLAKGADVPVNAGYVSFDECRALIDEARAIGHDKIVLTNPHTSMRQSVEQISGLCEGGGVVVELTSYSMHPQGPSKRDPAPSLDNAVALVRRLGVGCCVLSSDGGMADAPASPDLLRFVVNELHQRGLTPSELAQLVRSNPAHLLRMETP